MRRPIIRWLDEGSELDLSEVGGKAANGGRLKALGWPTPDGFCITTAAYERFVAANRLNHVLDLSRAMKGGEAEVNDFWRQARTFILAGEIPEEVATALEIASRRLRDTSPAEMLGVAVRSSATVEDLRRGSFAGVFHTSLNVVGMDALLLQVKECWASLWSASALTWMKKCDLQFENYGMAVLVQRMVKADASGVMFTANPVTGNPFEIVINSTWGLGDGVVSGEMASDAFVIDEMSLAIKAQNVAEKLAMISPIPSSQGGVSVCSVDEARRNAPSLRAEQVVRLAQLGLRLQKQFRGPQDVEWAISGGEIFVLQTRPIVGVPAYFPVVRADSEHLPPCEWNLEFRDLFSPFGQSLERLKNPVYRGACSRALGAKVTNHQKTFNGYIYHHEVVQKPAVIPSPLFRAAQFFRWLVLARDAERKFREGAIPSFEQRMEQLRAALPQRTSLQELIQLLDRAIESYLTFEAEAVLVGVLANAFCSLLMRFCQHVLKGSSLEASTLFVGVPNKTAQRDAALARLVSLAREPRIQRLFNGTSSLEQLIEELNQSEAGHEFLRKVEQFRQEFGYCWADGETKDPGWRENSELVFSVLKNAGKRFPKRLSSEDEGQRFCTEVETRLSSSWIERLIPLRLKCFRTLVLLAKRYYPCREDYNHYLSSGVMLIRRILSSGGQWLVSAGLTSQAEDIFQLTYEEILALPQVLQGGKFARYAELIQRRRLEWQRQKRLTPPTRLVLEDAAFQPSHVELNGTRIAGVPGSPGLAVGPACVVNRAELGKARAGDIVICDYIRPDWSPVFMYIRGVVTDRGYMLSHGANLAREYGLPAVMGTQVATQVIRDGDLVRVDGTRGVVWIEPFRR